MSILDLETLNYQAYIILLKMSSLNINKFQIEDFKLKEMKCEFNILSKSDGSAILSQGETVVLVSVNGPLETKMQSQTIEKGLLEVLFLWQEWEIKCSR